MRRLGLLTLSLLALSLVLVVPLPAAQATSAWGWPLKGTPTVGRQFRPPASAWGAGHRGVDLEGTPGQPVLSAGPGRVTYAGPLAGRGVVTVTHDDGLRTTYEPVDASVSVGDLVETGDQLGTLAAGHASCGLGLACLHWGLLRGEVYLDPMSLISPGHLRLLPLTAGPPPDHDKHRKHKRRTRAQEEEKAAEKGEQKAAGRFAKMRAGIGRAASHVGRLAARGARAAGRLVVRAAVGAGRNGGRLLVRAGLRAAPYALRAAPFALEAVPYVALGTLVVGGTIWYLRHR